MMVKCAIKTCGLRKDCYNHALTLHRLPRNEKEKKKWLDAIGIKNINLNLKNCYICSVHFEESCFNRTLDVIRLKDNSIPSLFLNSPAPEVNLLYPVQLPAVNNTKQMVEQRDDCQLMKLTSSPPPKFKNKTQIYPSEDIKIINPRSLRDADPLGDKPDPLRDDPDSSLEERVTPVTDVKQERGTDHNYLRTAQTNKLNTLNTRWRALTKKLKRYRELLRRRERKMAALQADVEPLRSLIADHDANEESDSDKPRIQVLSSKDGVVKNKPNRAVLDIKSADRPTSEASLALPHRRKLLTFVDAATRVGVITTDVGQSPVGVATSAIRQSPFGVTRTIRIPKSSVKILQKSDVLQKSDILQKSLEGVLPASDVLPERKKEKQFIRAHSDAYWCTHTSRNLNP